jgi:hypothetical protein
VARAAVRRGPTSSSPGAGSAARAGPSASERLARITKPPRSSVWISDRTASLRHLTIIGTLGRDALPLPTLTPPDCNVRCQAATVLQFPFNPSRRFTDRQTHGAPCKLRRLPHRQEAKQRRFASPIRRCGGVRRPEQPISPRGDPWRRRKDRLPLTLLTSLLGKEAQVGETDRRSAGRAGQPTESPHQSAKPPGSGFGMFPHGVGKDRPTLGMIASGAGTEASVAGTDLSAAECDRSVHVATAHCPSSPPPLPHHLPLPRIRCIFNLQIASLLEGFLAALGITTRSVEHCRLSRSG